MHIWIGLLAGFGATVVLSAMMLARDAIGMMPQFDMIGMMAGMMGGSRAMAWLVHFIAGTVLYGGAFVVLIAVLGTEAYIWTGLLLGAIGWPVASVMMMPMGGNQDWNQYRRCGAGNEPGHAPDLRRHSRLDLWSRRRRLIDLAASKHASK